MRNWIHNWKLFFLEIFAHSLYYDSFYLSEAKKKMVLHVFLMLAAICGLVLAYEYA